MATAQVAGVAALLLSARAGLTPTQLKTLLLTTASHGGGGGPVAQPVQTASVAALRAMRRGQSLRLARRAMVL